MKESQNNQAEEIAVREVIEAWATAVRRRDFEGIIKNHSSDIVMFDVPPPFQSKGIDAYRQSWDLFFSWSSDTILFEITSLDITAGNDVAFAVATMRCAGPGTDGEQKDLAFRLTIGLRKIGGQWIITHEHHSIPAEN